MAEIYRNLLVLICLGLIGWGLIRIERIYQYPFFMGAIFLSFLVPQAFALVDNSGSLEQFSLERVLLISSLCAIACWIGYQPKPNLKFLNFLNVEVDKNKLFRVSIFLMLIGYLFYFLFKSSDYEKGANGGLTGSSTIFLFFSQVIYIAFSIFLLEVLKKPSTQNIILTLLAAWIPIQRVLMGRRQPTMVLIIMIGLSLWLIRRYLPPRWLIVTTLFLMFILIPVLGSLRGSFWQQLFNGNWQAILSTTETALEIQKQGDILELRNAAFLIEATIDLDLYGLGAGWWDAVMQLVPGQLLGFGFKQSLQFNLITNETLYDLYGYAPFIGTTPTGVGDSFVEFGYLGSLSFALIAYFFKHLWISACYQKSLLSALLYMGLIGAAMISLTHGIGRFCQEAVFQIGVIGMTIFYARKQSKVLLVR